jgi:hypothetical protein
MLTNEQKRTLKSRHDENVSPQKKADIVYRYTGKLKDRLDSLTDITYLLNELPEGHKAVSKKNLWDALDLVDRLLEILDPWPVGEHKNGGQRAFKTYGSKFPNCEPGKCGIQTVSRTAFEEDVELHHRLKDHSIKLLPHIDPCVPDPICRDPQYAGELYEKTTEIAKELASRKGESFSGEISNYLDEYLVEDSSWVHRKPSVVEIDQLKAMRWKPRDLKTCSELPQLPLLGEKKIPRGPELSHLSVHVTQDDIHYSLSENGGAERPITEEEYLEYNERHNREQPK